MALAFTITLPPLATATKPVAISIIACDAPSYTAVAPDGSDKINGVNTPWLMADSGVDTTSDANAGGTWLFRPSANASIGWKCSRHLQLPVT